MSDQDLQLEKINASRINSLEDRLERSVSHLDSKIDKVLEIISKSNNAPGQNGYVLKSVSAVFAILLPFLALGATLGFNLYTQTHESLKAHILLEAHPEALKGNAGLQARLEGMNERLLSVDARVENFKRERKRIDDLEVASALVLERVKAVKEISDVKSKDRHDILSERIGNIEHKGDNF